MSSSIDREAVSDAANPLGLDGIEFIEYATSRPQALGQVLETMGFRPVARHRSREVLLYRQGGMNVVINAHASHHPRAVQPGEAPVLSAIALRVRDAGAAYRRALDRGAWPVPSNVEVMELNIPAIHGVGASRIYFVDRHREFSIYDVDFTRIPGIDPQPPALAGLCWFGVVQYIGNDRMEDWTAFYAELFGFCPLPDEQRFGILPKGRLLRSPCHSFFLQLIEPEPGLLDVEGEESLQRIGLGAPDDCRVLLVCSSTSTHASTDLDAMARDLRKLAMLAVPLNIRVAFEGLSWGRTINQFSSAWDVVCRADAPNLGLGFDSFHMFAAKTPLDELDAIDPEKIFLVQLADFMWTEVRSFEERMATAPHFRVFPGEGVHSDALAELVLRLDKLGYRGDYSFEVFDDDYQQIPLEAVAQRARRSALSLGEDVLRRAVPLPNAMRLRRREALRG